MGVVDDHLVELLRDYPEARSEARGDGTTLVTVPSVALPSGWNQAQTTVQFLAPVGYPMAKPDCFWTDEGLRLASGGMPKATGIQTPAFSNQARLWFSWHVSEWNGSRDTIRSFMAAIMHRLSRAE